VISRAGTPPPLKEAWVSQVTYLRGDALEPRTYEDILSGEGAGQPLSPCMAGRCGRVSLHGSWRGR
jgi:hypothetical protein